MSRRICPESDCDGQVEASVPLWLDLYTDGWAVSGVNDDNVTVSCSNVGHTISLSERDDKSLTAFLEAILPGTTWQGSDPRHPLNENVVMVQMSVSELNSLAEYDPTLRERITVLIDGRLA